MPKPATPVAAAARQAVLDRLTSRERLTGEYPLILSEQVASAAREAQDRFLAAEQRDDEQELTAARAALTAAMTALAEQTVTLRFEALPPAAYRRLIEEHRPTEEQQARAEQLRGLQRWNPDTFPDALIAATCIDPGFDSVEQVAALFSSDAARVSPAEAVTIFEVARMTCEGVREVADWGKAFGGTAS